MGCLLFSISSVWSALISLSVSLSGAFLGFWVLQSYNGQPSSTIVQTSNSSVEMRQQGSANTCDVMWWPDDDDGMMIMMMMMMNMTMTMTMTMSMIITMTMTDYDYDWWQWDDALCRCDIHHHIINFMNKRTTNDEWWHLRVLLPIRKRKRSDRLPKMFSQWASTCSSDARRWWE